MDLNMDLDRNTLRKISKVRFLGLILGLSLGLLCAVGYAHDEAVKEVSEKQGYTNYHNFSETTRAEVLVLKGPKIFLLFVSVGVVWDLGMFAYRTIDKNEFLHRRIQCKR